MKKTEAYFIFSQEMHGHLELGFLASLTVDGTTRVPVEILDTKQVPIGTSVCFAPIKQRGVRRWALSKYFESYDGQSLFPR